MTHTPTRHAARCGFPWLQSESSEDAPGSGGAPAAAAASKEEEEEEEEEESRAGTGGLRVQHPVTSDLQAVHRGREDTFILGQTPQAIRRYEDRGGGGGGGRGGGGGGGGRGDDEGVWGGKRKKE